MSAAPVHSVHDDRDHIAVPGAQFLAARRARSPLVMLGQNVRSTTQSRIVARILDAATEAVADCGLDGLSMEDVAMRANCSRATVYRRVGGKDALRDAVLDEAINRVNSSVYTAVANLSGDERVVGAIVASLRTIRADPVSAALLTGPAAGLSVSTALISRVIGSVARITGLAERDDLGCELVARLVLSLLCWPGETGDAELAVIRRQVGGGRAADRGTKP